MKQGKKYGIIMYSDESKSATTKAINKKHNTIFKSMNLHSQYFLKQEAIPNISLTLSRKRLEIK